MTKEEEKNSYRERYLQILSEFCLMDDSYMTLFFGGNIETTQLLLRIILEDPGITVIETVGQFEIKNPNGRSVRLDIHAVDANGQHFDVEVQRQDAGAAAERARFNSSMLDTKMATVGDKIPKLKPAYTIFITENDVLGGGCPLYHIDRKITELDNQLFGDGSHIIYVNGAYTNEDSPIGKLVHDFRCKSPDEMYYEIFSDRDRYFKETEGGRDDMCKLMDDFKNEILDDFRNEITEEVTKRVSKETAIETTIRTCRKHRVSESEIFAEIMEEYCLTESQAKSYLDSSRESA